MKYIRKTRLYLLGLVAFGLMAGAGMTLQGQALADTIDGTSPASVATAPACDSSVSDCSTPAPAAPSLDPTDGTTTPGNTATTSTSPPATTPDPTTSVNDNTNVATDSQQAATSGDANVSGTGDNNVATSGNASDSLTQVNAADSSVGSGTLTVYTDNIAGNQSGNVTINPNDATQVTTVPVNVISGSDSSVITNTVTAGAQTGDATVAGDGSNNTATSGNADVSANLVNIVDSTVTDQNTFVGTVNIYGTLTGDILIPQSFLNQLLTDSGATAGASQASGQSAVNNTVTLVAISGSATVDGAGSNNSATSGNATTSLNELNYVGNTTGNNILLIIINVLGHWYGAVLQPQANSPAIDPSGSTAGVSPSAQTTTKQTINNNIELTAQSGNSLIRGAGSNNMALSGNALVAANIVNLVNDQMSLSGWFGILFINVFGTWTGNLATYNDSGQITPSVITTTPQTPVNVDQNLCATTAKECMTYVPYHVTYYYTYYTSPGAPTGNAVLASATLSDPVTNAATNGNVPTRLPESNTWLRTLLFILPGLLLIALERYVSKRQKKAGN